jgi:ribulose-5-phosphate 4-epimerase/fuculose-1-phosphate aldolase
MLETISELFQEAYNRNWITARDGNASIRWHDRDHFYITPTGIRKQYIQPEMFKKINLTTTTHATPPFIRDTWEEITYTDITIHIHTRQNTNALTLLTYQHMLSAIGRPKASLCIATGTLVRYGYLFRP